MLYLPRAKSLVRLPWLWLPKPFGFAGGYPCCCDQSCEGCSGTTPDEFQVTLPAMSNIGCFSCADYAGNYIVAKGVPPTVVEEYKDQYTSRCSWLYTFSSHPCNGETLQDWLWLFYNDQTLRWQVYLNIIGKDISGNDYPEAHQWRKEYVDPPDCTAFSDEALGVFGTGGFICSSLSTQALLNPV